MLTTPEATAFAPLGPTVTFTAATPTPPTAVQATVNTGETAAGMYRIVNVGAVTVFLGVGTSSALAITAASALATSIPMVAGAVEILRFAPNLYFTGLSASSTAVVYVTQGQGL